MIGPATSMKNIKKKSVLTHFISVSVVLFLIVAIYNSLTLKQQYQSYSRVVNSGEILKECHSLFQVVRHYGFERGRVNVVLNFKGPAEEIKSSIDFLRQHKVDGDRDLSEVLKNLSVLPRYKDIPIIDQIITTQKDINRLRNQYEQQFLLSFQARDSELDDLWFNIMSQQIRQINFLIYSLMQKTQWSNEQKPLAETYYVLSQLRDYSGPVVSYLKAASFNVKSLTKKRIDEIIISKGGLKNILIN
jgi:hypothetical protein